MENSHTFVRSPSPRPPYEYSSPVLFSLLLCFAVKQSCNVRRLPSILIESAVMDEPKQLPRDGRLRRREKNSSVSGLPRTTALDSLNDSSISLSDPVPLSSVGFLIKFAPLIGFRGLVWAGPDQSAILAAAQVHRLCVRNISCLFTFTFMLEETGRKKVTCPKLLAETTNIVWKVLYQRWHSQWPQFTF